MSQTVHPLDDELVDFSIAEHQIIRIFGRDGAYDPEERSYITLIKSIHGGVGDYRCHEVAADAYKKNGNTRRTRDLFRDAGDRITSLDDERNARKIVPFPGVGDEEA